MDDEITKCLKMWEKLLKYCVRFILLPLILPHIFYTFYTFCILYNFYKLMGIPIPMPLDL